MRTTFRAKLLAIVGTAALAFVVLIVSSTLIATSVERNLSAIQERYIPKMALAPQLEAQLERLGRSFQDAVAAHDNEALERTRDVESALFDQLSAAGSAVDPAEAAALRRAVEDYYAAAYDVSRRILAGETGEGLVDAMSAMQAKQATATDQLKKTTSIDRRELAEAFGAAAHAQATAARVRLAVTVGCLVAVLILSFWLSRGVLRSLTELTAGLSRFGKGDFATPILLDDRDELGEVAQHANHMASSLRSVGKERDRADWLRAGHAGLAAELRGELEPEEVANRSLRFLARYLDAPAALLYAMDDDRVLRVLGRYALSAPADATSPSSFRAGEGLVGQAAIEDEITIIRDPPPDYLRVRSGLGDAAPRVIVLLPLRHARTVLGVVELALFTPLSEQAAELLRGVEASLAIALQVARARADMRDLLAETRRQATRLASQEEELRANNEELQTQQEELRQTNEELAQQTDELQAQRRILEERNLALDEARMHLEKKAEELATVSTYKSQFLANMSHELRTPLNSMLLLSNLLAENDAGNLTAKQVEFATTIHGAGKDLLALINQVLDLAKVEAGKQELRVQGIPLREVVEQATRIFGPLAREKGLAFEVILARGLPDAISTDGQRVTQILNNLLANAIKFTERGEVSLRIQAPARDVRFDRAELAADRVVAFVVTDSGIGIAPEHQSRIFAPFEQVESAADRRYGGTGLGLTIARELASLLGGELHLHSSPGTGSIFTLYLPYERSAAVAESIAQPAVVRSSVPAAPAATPEPYLLVIEDDPAFAEAFGDAIRAQGVDYVVAKDGETGLRLARERTPRGIILDVKLPDTDGWKIMEALQADPRTAVIPVHFVSALDAAERGMAMGAIGYLTKPATRADLVRVVESLAPRRDDQRCRVLIVEDDAVAAESVAQKLAGENLDVSRVARAREALDALRKRRFDCIILDLSLPDMDGLALLQSIEKECGHDMPAAVVYASRALSKAESIKLESYAAAVVLREGSSAERLRDEVRLFARRLKEGLATRRRAAAPLHPADMHMEGRKVLVVDDDMRTVYALSATLRAKGIDVLVADTGRAALSVLAERTDVEAVLMDIMMPEMDGYEATRRIRDQARYRDLPIIALTAKAMKDDREKCLEAGATDYLPKPIDPDRLLAVLHSNLNGRGAHAT